jgi:CheY-like chemotaxis protein
MSSQKPVILVVDDEPFNLEIIAEYLEGADYELAMTNSGEMAWSMLQAEPHRYSAVILDRMMPVVDGIEVLRRIKRDKVLKMLPVIIQTAAAAPEQVAEGLREGAFYYLAKPFNPTVLRAVVATAMRDRAEYFVEKQDVDDKLRAFQYLEDATFEFHTIQEAR